MSTRDISFTNDERRLLLLWADVEWVKADDKRMTARIGSDQEAAYLAEQQAVETIQAKLR